MVPEQGTILQAIAQAPVEAAKAEYKPWVTVMLGLEVSQQAWYPN